jgi:hypothetical protein
VVLVGRTLTLAHYLGIRSERHWLLWGAKLASDRLSAARVDLCLDLAGCNEAKLAGSEVSADRSIAEIEANRDGTRCKGPVRESRRRNDPIRCDVKCGSRNADLRRPKRPRDPEKPCHRNQHCTQANWKTGFAPLCVAITSGAYHLTIHKISDGSESASGS